MRNSHNTKDWIKAALVLTLLTSAIPMFGCNKDNTEEKLPAKATENNNSSAAQSAPAAVPEGDAPIPGNMKKGRGGAPAPATTPTGGQ